MSSSMDEFSTRSKYARFSAITDIYAKLENQSEKSQEAILNKNISFVETQVMVTLLDLLTETNSEFLETQNWNPYKVKSRDPSVPVTKVSFEFCHQLELFLEFQKNFKTYEPNGAHCLDSEIVFLLLKKHGEMKVIEAMKLWRVNQTSNLVSDFCKLVEAWDAVKHANIEWALVLLEVEPVRNKAAKTKSR